MLNHKKWYSEDKEVQKTQTLKFWSHQNWTFSMNLAKPRNGVWKQIIANFIISFGLSYIRGSTSAASLCSIFTRVPVLQEQYPNAITSCCHAVLVEWSTPKLHLAHGRAAAATNSGVRPFTSVAQSFKQVKNITWKLKQQPRALQRCFHKHTLFVN